MDFEYLANNPVLKGRKRRQDSAKTNLFGLAAQIILENKPRFCHLAQHTGENPFKCLPDTVRANLVERKTFYLTDSRAQESCRFLQMLMNDQVRTLSLSSMPKTDEAMRSVTNTWQLLTKKCPRLQKLVCDETFKSAKSHGLLDFFSFSLHFTQLRVLDVPNMKCNNLRLSLVSQHLPQLRVLRVTLERSVDSEGIASLAKLEHLREFLYHDKPLWNNPKSKNLKFFAWCLQLLPNLYVSCSRIEIDLELDIFLHDFASKAFRKLQGRLPNQLGLRQLALHGCSGLPAGVAFPDLTTLYLILPKENFQFSPRSSTVTEIGLQGINQQLLDKMLTFIGRQLQKLSILVWDTLILDRVFRKCPNLHTLYVSQFPTCFIGLEEPLGAINLSCLTELGLVMQEDECASFESGHLLRILRAAYNLRVLRLKNVFFTIEEEEEIGEALEQLSILQNLELLTCCYERMMGPEIDAEILECMECSYSLIRNIIKHCHKLSTFKLYT